MKLAVVILVLLGCLAAGAAVILVNLFIDAEVEREVEVLVAVQDLTPLSKIEALHVKRVPVAKAAVVRVQGHLVDPVEAIGKVLSKSISKGQLITASCFLSDEAEFFSTEIPEGMQAFTIALPNSEVMSGLLYPHCRVDIYGAFDLRQSKEEDALGTEILQAVEVLAIEYKTMVSEGGKGDESRSGYSNSFRVTFALTPDQVKTLQLSVREGDISLTLRNPQDLEIRPSTNKYVSSGTFHGETLGSPSLIDSDPNDGHQDRAAVDSGKKVVRVEVIRGPKRIIILVPGPRS